MVVFLAYWLVCFVLTHLPIPQEESSLPDIPHADKIAHFGMYFLLAFAMAFIVNRSCQPLTAARRLGTFMLAVLICALYGIFDELSQNWVPTRSADVLDWLTDLAGATAGVMVLGAILSSKTVRDRLDQTRAANRKAGSQ